jgi:hypothetical protein
LQQFDIHNIKFAAACLPPPPHQVARKANVYALEAFAMQPSQRWHSVVREADGNLR